MVSEQEHQLSCLSGTARYILLTDLTDTYQDNYKIILIRSQIAGQICVSFIMLFLKNSGIIFCILSLLLYNVAYYNDIHISHFMVFQINKNLFQKNVVWKNFFLCFDPIFSKLWMETLYSETFWWSLYSWWKM